MMVGFSFFYKIVFCFPQDVVEEEERGKMEEREKRRIEVNP